MITVNLKGSETLAVLRALAGVVGADDWADPETFHGGLGLDLCACCDAMRTIVQAINHCVDIVGSPVPVPEAMKPWA